MQLINLVALFATAMAVSTSPAAPLEARQGTPRVRATFYNGGGCEQQGFPWQEDFVFTQTVPVGVCQDFRLGPWGSTYFNESSITRTFRFYNRPCSEDEEAGQHFDLLPGNTTPGCMAQAIRSWKVL